MGTVIPIRPASPRHDDLGAAERTSPGPNAHRPPLWRDLVGAFLRQTRSEQQRILADVASSAGVSTQYLSEIERGRKEPSSEILGAVAEALGLSLLDVAAGVGALIARQDAERMRRLVSMHRMRSSSVPARSETLDPPSDPGEPLLPGAPGLPGAPDAPEPPQTPFPDNPGEPAQPERPLTPAEPDQPLTPAEPIVPLDSSVLLDGPIVVSLSSSVEPFGAGSFDVVLVA